MNRIILIGSRCIPKYVKRSKLYTSLKNKIIRHKYNTFQKQYVRVEKELKNKDVIKVAFFLIHDSVWKLDRVFQLMLEDVRFEPIIVICPYIKSGRDEMLRSLKETEDFIKKNNYPYVIAYNINDDTYLDVKSQIKPDIIFYTNPYKGITNNRYYIDNYPDSLNCYVPYSSMISSHPVQFNKPLQSKVWKFFLENELTAKLYEEESINQGNNAAITGFPSLDDLLDIHYKPKNIWTHNQQIKIIWAPHHTIEDNPMVNFSTFLAYADKMVTLALKYKEQIQISFKPHPLLYPKLIEIWGEKETNSYYLKWSSMDNTQINTGEYIDLFCTSDAMIFDSVSFICEYLYTQKPSLFLCKDGVETQLNEFGLKAFNCHQKALSTDDIERFIENIIFKSEDTLIAEKQIFYNEYLLPPNNKTASENIFDILLETITK